MCDMIVALPGATAHGRAIFAKNSDRNIGEPQPTVRVPASDHDLTREPTVRCTYIGVPQVPHTYECVLCKPSWMWGAEMGVNEHGLAVGNTAVFTKEPEGPDSLIGMDYVRLCAERCKTADEACDLILSLMDTYGQGGNCGYRIPRSYHNCYLIADAATAWIIETAGVYWVAKRVREIGNISNRLSIGSDFDRCHPDVIAHAVETGLCDHPGAFSFKDAFTIPDGPQEQNGSAHRFSEVANRLRTSCGQIDEDSIFALLRMHEGEPDTGDALFDHKSTTVCMHAGHDGPAETAGSMLVTLEPARVTTWVSGMSLPCVSIYKPLWFGAPMPIHDIADEERATDYWMKRETLIRMLIEHRVGIEAYERERAITEEKIRAMAALVESTPASPQALAQISAQSFALEEDLIDRVLEAAAGSPAKRGGCDAYNAFFEEQDRILPLPRFFE